MSEAGVNVRAGDRVYLKTEWTDAGEEKFTFRALEDAFDERVLVVVEGTGLSIPPTQMIETRMIERVEKP